ncbi:hypothetical protein ACPA54_38725 [Uniformispora flossi]|uniref:hypothetical protein n=1 Tax=Uniformispora flossi TaxID=3390723 RepID=UPI003C2D61FB
MLFGLSAVLAAGTLSHTAPAAQAADQAIPSDGSTLTTAAVQEGATAKASSEAAKTGKPVEIAAKRTEDTKTFANPDGTYTQDRYLRPVHVRKNGAYVEADASLVAAKDGTVRPKAARAGFAFSNGGGKLPLATMVRDGREIALTWPGKLPKPTLSGNTATYPEVLPGVDLKVVADVDSFSHVLVVKSAEAARNPKLAKLDFGLKAKGLTVKAGPDGALTAVNPAGQTVFSAPPPRMWDGRAGLRRHLIW